MHSALHDRGRGDLLTYYKSFYPPEEYSEHNMETAPSTLRPSVRVRCGGRAIQKTHSAKDQRLTHTRLDNVA